MLSRGYMKILLLSINVSISHTIECDLAKKLPFQNSKQTNAVHCVTLQGMKDTQLWLGYLLMTETRVFVFFAILQ